jgi:hypothetical protein
MCKASATNPVCIPVLVRKISSLDQNKESLIPECHQWIYSRRPTRRGVASQQCNC